MRGNRFCGDVNLNIISITVETEVVLMNDVAKRKDVNDQKKRPQH